jgi:hypothetical protein
MIKAIGLFGFAFGLAFLFASHPIAFGQAGSVGGTVGKTDKSASGGEQSPDRSETKKSAGRAATSLSCDHMAGSWRWSWLDNTVVVTLMPGGSVSATNGNRASWTCSGRTLTVDWPAGPDRLILSSDGKHLEGTGFMGVAIKGTLIARP